MRSMFLNGTAMSGEADHGALRGARFLGPAQTAAHYRFLAVRDAFPGLLPVTSDGGRVIGELYEIPEDVLFGSLMPAEPAELELGAIELDNGQIVNAMHLRLDRVQGGDRVIDITRLGGWRAYRAHRSFQAGAA